MAEPTIICPKCKNEIKLTESLAAPLIESTRRDFEQRLAQKDLDVAGREKAIQEREAALSKAKDSLESKRTKNWSDGWLAKLRDDQRAAKAEIAVIISQVLPKGVETFGLVEGVASMPGPGRKGAQYSVELLEKARADSDTVLKELGSQLGGLSGAEADSRLKQVGANEIAR